MKKLIALLGFGLIVGAPGMAQAQQAQSQGLTLAPVSGASVSGTSAPQGSVYNIQQNNNETGLYSIGMARCSTAAIVGSAYSIPRAGNFDQGDSLAGTIALVVPLSGETGRLCRELAAQEVRRATLANTAAMIDKCIAWQGAGYTRLPEPYGTFCSQIGKEPLTLAPKQ